MLRRELLNPVRSRAPSAGVTIAKCVAGAWTAALQLRHGWLRAIGAPNYQAYLVHHAQHHRDTPPMSEREYVKIFIERRYNRRGAGRCC